MSTPHWTLDHLPDLNDRVIVVTGANSGLGLETTRALAHRGAHVIMACRSESKAQRAAESIRHESIAGRVEPWVIDLARLDSIEAFAERFVQEHRSLYALCNNAGVMATPYVQTTDGFEMQLGINHLGHFALTGRLLPTLLATPGSRVVTVSSLMHRMGQMQWEDLQSERRYRKWRAYGQSKLANLLFAFELQRRLEGLQVATISLASHPGYAATNLQASSNEMADSAWGGRLIEVVTNTVAQSAAMGALPSLYALTSEEARGGDFIGPDGWTQLWGYPVRVEPSAQAQDAELSARLWGVSEDLTGVRYDRLSH